MKKDFLKKNKIKIIIAFFAIFVIFIAHAYNMFHFPYYENDEGTYMSQAWSILHLGRLAPYTYWYDHAPAGWILIFIWSSITGFFTFGMSVNSGRVLMLIIHLASSMLLFFITLKLTKSYLAGIASMLIFSLSVLGIYFQRRVLLDNIMIFWILASLASLLKDELKLRHIIASSIFFGIAVLTKENAIFFGPALLFALYIKAHFAHKNIAIVKWITISGFIISFYFLYALLKQELFPVGFLGDQTQHTSLISTLKEQLGRGNNLPFWNKDSDFYKQFIIWTSRDFVLIYLGLISTIVNGILSIKVKSLRIPALFSLMFWLFLIRGKLVIDFYIIPLLPFLALNIVVLLNYILNKITFSKKKISNILMLFICAVIIGFQILGSQSYLVKDETTPQIKAFNWIVKNVPKDSVIAIDDFAETDYRQNGYKNAFWFFKIWEDPQVKDKYKYDWRNIEFIYLSHEMLKQIGFRAGENDVLKLAFKNSNQIVKYGPNSNATYLDIENFQTSNGDWAAVYKLNDKDTILADEVWSNYKNKFIKSYGQSYDPSREFSTTSEGQSYILLRSLYQNDQDMFRGAWDWTRDHMQNRIQDKLISWLWGEKEGKEQLIESASASDANIDIALALLLASNKWDNQEYLNESKKIMDSIWNQNVVKVSGKYYLIAGEGFKKPDGYILNPSYFSPAAYRQFAKNDKKHAWNKLADDTYFALNKINALPNNEVNLPTNWIFLSKSGELGSAKKYIQSEPDYYGFDAFRTFWRIALDYKWYKNKDAKDYLLSSGVNLFNKEIEKNKIYSAYDLEGNPVVNYSNISVYAGPLSILSVTDKDKANKFYNKSIKPVLDSRDILESSNYYDQNWIWFGHLLYKDKLVLYD